MPAEPAEVAIVPVTEPAEVAEAREPVCQLPFANCQQFTDLC